METTPIYVQDKSFGKTEAGSNTYAGNTSYRQRRAMGMAGSKYDATGSFNENSAGALYLKEKGLWNENGIDMSSRRNRRLLARAERRDRRQARRDNFLTQVLGQTYQYGKIATPAAETPATKTPATKTTTETPVTVAKTQTPATQSYKFSGFSGNWGSRMQDVYNGNKGYNWAGIDTNGDYDITSDELMAWQKSNGLKADGKLGYNTFTKMFGQNANYSDYGWINAQKKRRAAATTNTLANTGNNSLATTNTLANTGNNSLATTNTLEASTTTPTTSANASITYSRPRASSYLDISRILDHALVNLARRGFYLNSNLTNN